MRWYGRRAVRDGRGSGRAEDWREDEQEQDNLRESIKGVLTEVFDRHNEVPFRAMYRKQVTPLSSVATALLSAHTTAWSHNI